MPSFCEDLNCVLSHITTAIYSSGCQTYLHGYRGGRSQLPCHSVLLAARCACRIRQEACFSMSLEIRGELLEACNAWHTSGVRLVLRQCCLPGRLSREPAERIMRVHQVDTIMAWYGKREELRRCYVPVRLSLEPQQPLCRPMMLLARCACHRG